jgi:hypothetical protein
MIIPYVWLLITINVVQNIPNIPYYVIDTFTQCVLFLFGLIMCVVIYTGKVFIKLYYKEYCRHQLKPN